jgi:inositol 1,4,5-triphosphate receptor type 1/inositol 1,4,5-triphosphate receptor type 3
LIAKEGRNSGKFQDEKQRRAMVAAGGATLVPSLRNLRTDSMLFKLYAASVEEVFEIQFVLSSFTLLTNYMLAVNKHRLVDEHSEQSLNSLNTKIPNAANCVQNLEKFVSNKLGNSRPDQKFGTTNMYRQKLLQE